MLSIYKGDIKEVKAEMKSAKAEAVALRKTVMSGLKKAKRVTENLSIRDQKTVAEAEMTISFCEVTKFVPVYVELPGATLMLNYLMLKEFDRRLKGHRVFARWEYNEVGRALILEYSKGKNKGRLELCELPDVFDIPKGKIPEARFDDHITILTNVQDIREA